MNSEVKHILKLAVFRYDAADEDHRRELWSMVGARYFINLAETPQRLADFEAAAKIFIRYIKIYYL